MNKKICKLNQELNWLTDSIYFIRNHFTVIMCLGLVAALGRVIQLRGFGDIPYWLHIALEVVIEFARILLFIYVLGFASIRSGYLRIKRLFFQKNNRKLNLFAAWQKIKQHWFSVLVNFTGFLLIAAGINFLIEQLAYETCLFLTLKKDGILTHSSSEWTILLFFKNLSVIPFTLVFEALFLLWLTNKLPRTRSKNLV